jgi:hypothetical protein
MRDCTKSGISGRGAFSQTTPRYPDQPNDRSRCQDVGETLECPQLFGPAPTGALGNHQTSACRAFVPSQAHRLSAGAWRSTPVTAVRGGGTSSPKSPVIGMLTLDVKIHGLFRAVVQLPAIITVGLISPASLACGRCQYSVPSAAKPSGKHGAVTGGVK